MAILDDSLLCLSKFSTAGLQQLAGIQGDTKAKAIFWVSVFIGALALLGLQVNSLVAYLDSYPTRVNIEITEGPIIFPTVTFCSMGMLKRSIAMKIPVIQTIVGIYGPKSVKRKKRQTKFFENRKDKRNDNVTEPEPNCTNPNWIVRTTSPKSTVNIDLESSNITVNDVAHIENEKGRTNVAAYIPQLGFGSELANYTAFNYFLSRITVPPNPPTEIRLSSSYSNLDFNQLMTTTDNKYNADPSHSVSTNTDEHLAVHEDSSNISTKPHNFTGDPVHVRIKRSLAEKVCFTEVRDSIGCIYSCSRIGMSIPTLMQGSSNSLCLQQCIDAKAVSYRSHEGRSCACYNADCCTSTSYHTPDNPPCGLTGAYSNYVVSSIGQCDDVFDPNFPYGKPSSPSPYVQTNSVTYTCAANALTAQKAAIVTYECQPTGLWLPPFLPCIPGCSSLASGSVILPSIIPSGSSYTYTCPSGWFTAGLVQSVVYLCSNGGWNPIFQPCYPVCLPIFDTTGVVSPPPPFVSVPKTFSFTCKPNWLTAKLSTTESYTCSSAVVWDKLFQQCYAVCANIFDSTGSVWPLAPFVGIPESYTFTCKSNWLTVNLRSTESYTCSGSRGNWDRPFQQCYAVCPNIFDSTGVPSPSSPYMGFPKSYTFTCLSGYLLPTYAKTQQYTCNADASWTPPVLTACIKECPNIIRYQIAMQILYSGQIIDNNLVPSGQSGTFSCAANYTLFGVPKVTKCTSGTWDVTPPKYPQCLENCDPFDPSVLFERLNVKYSRTIPLINGTVTSFSCNDSFHMYGDYRFTTCNNGTWDVTNEDLPICLEQQVANYDAKTLTSLIGNNTGKDQLAVAISMRDIIPFITANLSDSMKSSMGFQQYDNLISCTYGPRVCDKSAEIRGFVDNSMGNCYSFNHKYQNQSLTADRPGEQTGLWWIFNTKQEEYLAIIPTVGVKLLIHQQFDPIFPDSMGTHVSPGFSYIFGLRRKTEQRLETPLSTCYASPSRARYYYVANVSYANEACRQSYYQSEVIKECGCGSPFLPNTNCGAPLCLLENRTCVNDFLNGDNSTNQMQQLIKYCPLSCSNIDERMVVTFTATAQNSVLFNTKKFSNDYQKSNFISVKVFFQTLEVIRFKEKLSYGILDFINDLASSIGSVIGMSCISLVELVVIIIQLVSYPVRKIIGSA